MVGTENCIERFSLHILQPHRWSRLTQITSMWNCYIVVTIQSIYMYRGCVKKFDSHKRSLHLQQYKTLTQAYAKRYMRKSMTLIYRFYSGIHAQFKWIFFSVQAKIVWLAKLIIIFCPSNSILIVIRKWGER